MTDSMYDKLGDLLKAALEKGDIPKSGKKKSEMNASTDERSHAFETRSESEAEDMFRASNGGERIKKAMHGGQRGGTKLKLENILRAKDTKNRGEVLKSENGTERARPFAPLPEHVKKAYEALGVKAGADESEIRSAYRKKLKLFHPDSNSENETIQRVAHKKTEEIVEAYKAIRAYKDSIG